MIDFTKFLGPCTRHVQSDEVTEKLVQMRVDYEEITEEQGIEILKRIVKQD